MPNFSIILKLASILASMVIDLLCIFVLLIAMASASGEPYRQAQAFFLCVIAISVNNVTIKDES